MMDMVISMVHVFSLWLSFPCVVEADDGLDSL